MKNPTTLKVIPINKDNLERYLSKSYKNKQNKILLSDEAIIMVDDRLIVIDCDCCFSIIHKRYSYYSKKVEFIIDVGVRFKRKTENGWSIPLGYSHYHPLSLSELEENNLLNEECSLKEFMGDRFNYNKRIKNNMQDLLYVINN